MPNLFQSKQVVEARNQHYFQSITEKMCVESELKTALCIRISQETRTQMNK